MEVQKSWILQVYNSILIHNAPLDKSELDRNNSNMSYQVDFGLTLQKARLERNLSQFELAELSDIDRTFISLLERGIRQPTLTTIFQLAKALKIKPSQMVAEVENRVRRGRWRRLKA